VVIDLGRDSQSIRQLIKDGGIDCVFVCSPNYTHWPYLKLVRSASPDVPIYLEKPAVNCPSALSELCSAESMCNVFVGFPLRHGLLGKHGYLAEVLKEHNACPEQTVFSSFIISYPYCLREAYCSSWKSDSTKSPWGVAENLAIHYIDLALALGGNLQSFATNHANLGKHQYDEHAAPDTFSGQLEFSDGVSHIHCSYSEQYSFFCRLVFKSYVIEINENNLFFLPGILHVGSSGKSCKPEPLIKHIPDIASFLFDKGTKHALEAFFEIVCSDNPQSDYDREVLHSLSISHNVMMGQQPAYRKLV